MMEISSPMMQQLMESRDAASEPASAAPRDRPEPAREPEQQLVALLDRIEDFATRQFRRLEMMIDSLGNACDDDAAPRETQLELRMQLWEEERSTERRRIQEEGRLLMCAWEKIEEEKRQLLGLRESLAAGRPVSGEPAIDEPRSAEETGDLEEMALSQFQKLRREIQRHARRGKSA